MKFLECSGSFAGMGEEYGEQAREEIQHNAGLFNLLMDINNRDAAAAGISRAVNKYLPDVYAELAGIARGANVDLKHILLMNHVDTFGSSAERCTPVILRKSSDGVIIAKNNDSPPSANIYDFILRKCTPDKGFPYIQLTYAGWLSGLDMMNAAGLANTHGSVGSVFDKSGDHIDMRLVMYEIMKNYSKVGDVIRQLSNYPMTGKGFNIALGDADGETAMLDAALPFIALSGRNKNFDYATNIYTSQGLEHADTRGSARREICVYRYGYLKWLEQTRMPENLTDVKLLLSSHEPWAPCRHGGPHGSKTDWSMINLVKTKKMLVADGAPCENKYKEYSI
jgi:hypothetical protein